MDDTTGEFKSCKERILANGYADADTVERLSRIVSEHRWVDRHQAKMLFELNDAISGAANDRGWRVLFVDALTNHFLEDASTRGELDSAEAAFMMSRIDTDGLVDDVELELMVNLCALAKKAPPEFHDYVLTAMKRKVVADGVIDETMADQIQRVIYGTGGSSGATIDRKEGNLLLDLNDATTGKSNHPTWKSLFLEALINHAIDDAESPGEVNEEKAHWLLERCEADGVYDDNELTLLNELRNQICQKNVWGGITNENLVVSTGGLIAGIYSQPCAGGKGGDVYFFSASVGDIITRVAIADVLGHGPVVSDISNWIFDLLDQRINNNDGHEVLAALNQLATDHGHRAITTAAVATYHRAESQLYFSYAGHPPILAHRSVEAGWRPLNLDDTPDLAHLPLGVTSESRYEQTQMSLAKGDRVCLFTDGVVETPNAHGEMFGTERLLTTLERGTDQPLGVLNEMILSSLRSHSEDDLSHDDVTFVTMEVV